MKITMSDTNKTVAKTIQKHNTTTPDGLTAAALELWAIAQGWSDEHGDIEISTPAQTELLNKTCLLLIAALPKKEKPQPSITIGNGGVRTVPL